MFKKYNNFFIILGIIIILFIQIQFIFPLLYQAGYDQGWDDSKIHYKLHKAPPGLRNPKSIENMKKKGIQI